MLQRLQRIVVDWVYSVLAREYGMDSFEAGQILRWDGISSNEQEGQENEAGAQGD
jgi:hypothetical protein